MIRVENLVKFYGDRPILKGISYHFPQGKKIALIGANGQGKTTFLNILLGLEEADQGQIIYPKQMRLGFLAQSANENPKETLLLECMSGHGLLYDAQKQMDLLLHQMAEAYEEKDYQLYEKTLKIFEENQGYEWEGNAEKILLGLGFKEEQLSHHPSTLSGGWRMRLELAKVLLSKPDFMILDEPTNHLDLPTIEWLESYLQNYPGTLLFVSHDRVFLNNLANVTLRLQQGTLTAYPGNLDDFLEQANQTAQVQEAARKKLLQRQAHMQSFVDRFRAKASKAAQAGSRMKMIEKINESLSYIPEEEKVSSLHIPKLSIPTSGKEVLRLEKLTIGYDKPLLKDINLILQRGQRVALVGANGIGKSTLFKTIAGAIPSLNGTVTLGHQVTVGFYTQDAAEKIRKRQTVWETMREANPELPEQTARAMLGAFLFRGQEVTKLVTVLSGGERSRLALCCLLSQQPNFLLLDEPTNHLDLTSSQIIGELLLQYTGTVLFISHDRDFVDHVATRLVEMKGTGHFIG